MNTNNKVLELTFTVEGSRSMTLSIPCPKDDLTLETVKEKASMITPVPGGVGPMTICMLMANAVSAAERRAGI